MTRAQRTVASLWWGPFRRPFEAVVRRTVGRSQRVITGPLAGRPFQGGLAQRLGIYEPHLQECVASHLRPGDIFYDIGANTGFFSLLAGRYVGVEGHVFAFEPYPKNIDQFRRMLLSNHPTNITLVPQVVSGRGAESVLYALGEDGATPSLVGGVQDPNRYTQLAVLTVTLEDFVASHPWPDLIKLDVEGAEVDCLRGASSLLAADPAPSWIVEIHGPATDAHVHEMLQMNGYVVSPVHPWYPGRSRYPLHIFAEK